MKVSRKNFVEFLEIRLTPKAARSYLDYVEAFQRAIKQKDDFLFNGKVDTKEYLIKFLNKEVHPPAFRKLYKESSRSNIRVGIRTLLLYYQYEEEKAIRKAQNRSKFVSLNLDNLLDEFQFWLSNRYLKPNGEKFKSGKAYSGYIKKACNDNKTELGDFCKIKKSVDLQKFIKSLEKNSNFNNRAKHDQQNILSGFRKYEAFLTEFYGEKQNELFAA